jgi:hypothetical protein
MGATKQARRARRAVPCVARWPGNEARTMKRKTLTSLRRLMFVNRCEHHGILLIVGRMMSAIHRDGNSATLAK